MVRKYNKAFGNQYMKRSKLSELEFLLILRGYAWLLSASEAVEYIKEYGIKKQVSELKVSRNTINQIFSKLNARCSTIVEGGKLLGQFPYGLDDLNDQPLRNRRIEAYMDIFYEVLSNKISQEKFKRLSSTLRKDESYPYLDSHVWECIKNLWGAMKGIKRSELRGQYNRSVMICFLIDRYMDKYPKHVETDSKSAAKAASRYAFEYLQEEIKSDPLK